MIILPLWGAFALAVGGCAWGLILGACAMIGPGRACSSSSTSSSSTSSSSTSSSPLPRPGRFTLVEDRPAPVPLPPEGLWDTVPLVLLSEHYALIDATGREADQMNAEYRRKYLH